MEHVYSRILVFVIYIPLSFFFFFFNDPATTAIYTLSLHDALPIWRRAVRRSRARPGSCPPPREEPSVEGLDRKSTRLNSSHQIISYAVFCLKKKKNSVVDTALVGGGSKCQTGWVERGA